MKQPCMALSESSNVGGGVPPHTHTPTYREPLSHSLHDFQQNIYSKSLSSCERSSNFGEANWKKKRQTAPSFAITSKNVLGRGSWGNVCHNGSWANMASTVHAEASRLHMVVIVEFAAEAWERKNKRMRTYNHIFVVLRPGCDVISLIGSKLLLKVEYHTNFVKKNMICHSVICQKIINTSKRQMWQSNKAGALYYTKNALFP